MNVKRVLTAVLGLPIVIAIFVFANKYVVDVMIAAIAIVALYEYFHAFKQKYHPIQWPAYICAIAICFVHLISMPELMQIIFYGIPIIVATLFIQLIVMNTRINVVDILITLFGTGYIVFFSMFLALLFGAENGKFLFWYAIIIAWGTDIFAYLAGKHFGKHKFSKISPNKSIEGCIGGFLGAVTLSLIYTYCINRFAFFDLSYLSIAGIAGLLSVIGQFGDFAASSIKRHVEIKDYGDIIPGHGGLLDRIDSLIFIAPFAYMLLVLF